MSIFFNLQLIAKQRHGAKITKKYDRAQTPYQRLISSTHLNEVSKEILKKQYEDLDPTQLLQKLKTLQSQFFQYTWKESAKKEFTVLPQQGHGNMDLTSSLNDRSFKDQQKVTPDPSFLQLSY